MNWTLSDFIVMALLILGSIATYIIISRFSPKKYRKLTIIGIILFTLYIWAELAVGIFTNWGN